MSIEHQEAERLATQLEAAAQSIRGAMKPPQRGVFLHRAKTGYTVCVDGFDLGLDTSWSDADALCKVIATRRPQGDEAGYGRGYHKGLPFGPSTQDDMNNTVALGISVGEHEDDRTSTVGTLAHVKLWDAINAFAVASGGRSDVTSGARMDAVAAIERAVEKYVIEVARKTQKDTAKKRALVVRPTNRT